MFIFSLYRKCQNRCVLSFFFFLDTIDFITLTALYREQRALGNTLVGEYISKWTSNICFRASQASKKESSVLNSESKLGMVVCLEIETSRDMIYSVAVERSTIENSSQLWPYFPMTRGIKQIVICSSFGQSSIVDEVSNFLELQKICQLRCE